MKDRLSKFMKSEGLVSSRFAEIMDVPPSNISHLLAGRNKPGYEFISKMLQRFPKLNPDWLILGSGAMYRGLAVNTVSVAGNVANSPVVATENNAHNPIYLPSQQIDRPINEGELKFEESTADSDSEQYGIESKSGDNHSTITTSDVDDHNLLCVKKEIERIVVFFKDHTFATYIPE